VFDADGQTSFIRLYLIFSTLGHEIDDCMMLEDNDIIFLSNGDEFIPPGSDSSSVLYLKNGSSWETIPSIISGYKIGKLLGRGGFGEVRMGEHQLTKETVALKFLRKAEIMSMGAAERTTTEIQCLSALKHAHIIRLQQVSGTLIFLYPSNRLCFPLSLSRSMWSHRSMSSLSSN
jgi:serine/threonine protein kinase